MMRDSLAGGDWLLVALGGATGLAWALASIVVGIQWLGDVTLPWWGDALLAVLLWLVFAAFHAPLPGADISVLTLAIGAATGGVGGLLLVWRLRG